jgi:hypothetical protein
VSATGQSNKSLNISLFFGWCTLASASLQQLYILVVFFGVEKRCLVKLALELKLLQPVGFVRFEEPEAPQSSEIDQILQSALVEWASVLVAAFRVWLREVLVAARVDSFVRCHCEENYLKDEQG